MVSTDSIRTAIGVLGNVISFGLFASPAPTFYRIWGMRTVEEFSAAPYLATLLNCMGWCLYGLPLVKEHSTPVLTINGIGVFIQGLYLSIFLLFSHGTTRLRASLVLLAEIVFIGSVAAVVLTTLHHREKRAAVIGLLCAFFGTIMYASPLLVMRMVIKTKSVEYMPFYLSLASLLNSLCWASYALVKGIDYFILVPNGLGVLFAIAQLILHLVYRESTRDQIKERESMRRSTAAAGIEIIGGNSNISQGLQNGQGNGTTQNGRRSNLHYSKGQTEQV